jgi:hypothetical protein
MRAAERSSAMMANRIGIGPGMSIILRGDGSPDFRGGSREEVFQQAVYRSRLADMDQHALDQLSRWIELMKKIIDEEEFEKRVLQAAEPRLKYAARLHRKSEYLLDSVKTVILNQEREKLKKDSKP